MKQRIIGKVGNLIIKPLKEAIGNANTLFISPDSEINRVPLLH